MMGVHGVGRYPEWGVGMVGCAPMCRIRRADERFSMARAMALALHCFALLSSPFLSTFFSVSAGALAHRPVSIWDAFGIEPVLRARNPAVLIRFPQSHSRFVTFDFRLSTFDLTSFSAYQQAYSSFPIVIGCSEFFQYTGCEEYRGSDQDF